MGRQFVGTGDSGLRVATVAGALDIAGAVDFSMAGWIKPDGANGNGTIAAQWETGVKGLWSFDILNGLLQFLEIRQGDGTVWTAQSAAAIPAALTHVMAIRTAADETVRLYINGTQDGLFDLNAHPHAYSPPPDFTIGKRQAGDNGFEGVISEFGWWGGVVLTAAERDQLLKGASPLEIRPATLKGYWPIYGNGTSTEGDLSGNRRNLTVANAAQATSHAPVRPIWLPKSA